MTWSDTIFIWLLQDEAIAREQKLAEELWQPVAKKATTYGMDAVELAEECKQSVRPVTAAGEIG